MKLRIYKLEKGSKAVIIAPEPKEDGEKRVSNVILHTAYVLSDNVEDIDKVKITKDDKLIYLCGHGNLERKTIGNRRMKDIAKLLVNGGYDGTQEIYVTACDSATKVNGSSMVDKLREELNDLLTDGSIYSEDKKLSVIVRSQSNGSSVIVEDNNERILYVITAENKVDRGIMDLQTLKQNLFKDKKVGICSDFEQYQKSLKDNVVKYKNRLIAKEFKFVEFENTMNWISVVIGISLAFTIRGLMTSFNIWYSLKYEVIIGGILLLLFDVIGRHIMKPRVDDIISTRFSILFVMCILRYFIYMYLIGGSILRCIFNI
ncbi:MAG: hypothetical protein N4A48_01040 [Tepidibacter sp.]|jgi:hypothetical protein|uniref:hypothetical protein n=1 Tax=Tepidibacter sp. TaxID=2529387 RepID=UPI0025ECD848|nr:hypothetical protein [Tepidibacter sp.]MCT4507345.1 hypothetical protein [Tepidibacter sp.]